MIRPSIWILGNEDLNLRIPFCQKLMDIGFDVTAIGTGEAAPFQQVDIPYKRYLLKRGINPFSDLHTFCALRSMIRLRDPDVVHGFDTKPSLLAAFAGAGANPSQAIRTINGMGYIFSSRSLAARTLRPVYDALQRSAKLFTAVTIFQNAIDRGYFISRGLVDAKKTVLIPSSGIDTNHFLAQVQPEENIKKLKKELNADDKVIITCVSRVTKEKGIPVLLAASEKIISKYKDILFLIVGPLEEEGFQAVPRKLLDKHAPYVKVLGRRNDVASILRLTDIFLFPTEYREGVPRVLLEAGTMGCPIITTNMPGCSEVVRHEWNGIIIEPSDPDTLAAAVSFFLDNPYKRKEFGSRSPQYIQEHFSLDRVVESHAAVYEKVLAAKAQG